MSTDKIMEDYCNKLLDKFKQDQYYEERLEFGKMLFRHIDSFTPDERKRYDELHELLTIKKE